MTKQYQADESTTRPLTQTQEDFDEGFMIRKHSIGAVLLITVVGFITWKPNLPFWIVVQERQGHVLLVELANNKYASKRAGRPPFVR